MTLTREDIDRFESLKSELTIILNKAQQADDCRLKGEQQESKVAEIGYTEAGQHLRSLNQFMWQVPSITIAVTGGLWYGVSLWENDEIKRYALGYLSLFDLLMVFVLIRMRVVLDRYIKLQQESIFERTETLARGNVNRWSRIFGWAKWKFLVIGIWSVLLFIASVFSAYGCLHPQLFTNIKKDSEKSNPIQIELINKCASINTHPIPPPIQPAPTKFIDTTKRHSEQPRTSELSVKAVKDPTFPNTEETTSK